MADDRQKVPGFIWAVVTLSCTVITAYATIETANRSSREANSPQTSAPNVSSDSKRELEEGLNKERELRRQTERELQILNAKQAENNSHVYPAVEIEAFIAACQQTAQVNFTPASAKMYCSCVISELQKNHNYGEFKQLNTQLEKSGISALSSSQVETLKLCSTKAVR